MWSAYALVYDQIWANSLIDEVGRDVALRMQSAPDLPVLEIGAGTGLITRAIDDGRPLRVVEPVTAMARRLRRRLPNVEIQQGSLATATPLTSRGFIVASLVLHVLDDPLSGLEQLRSLAGPEGTVIVVTPLPNVGLPHLLRALRTAQVSRRGCAVALSCAVLFAPIGTALGHHFRIAEAAELALDRGHRVEVVGGVLAIAEVPPG